MIDYELVNEFLEFLKTENAEEICYDYFYIYYKTNPENHSYIELAYDDIKEGNIKLLRHGLFVNDTYINGAVFIISFSQILFITTEHDSFKGDFGFP